MEIWTLGTLEVSHDGRAVEVRGPLPRRLLALLALSPGREASADRLVDGLWGETPPAAATATLQSHVARLRRDLPQPDAVRTGRRGYLLDVSPDDVDALVLQREVALGSKALTDGRVDEASRLLSEALRLWRGTPFAEFPDCPPLEAEAERLSALRLDALERRISADLRRPGVPPPVAELEALVRWHPVRESFWALLMWALYRAGRQGDALATYQRARTTLAAELGVEPGPALQEVERQVLAQDASLDGPGAPAFVPTRLDRDGAYPDRVALVERADLLETLTRLHEEALAGEGRLVLVQGEAGAGKSVLLREWCRTAGLQTPVLWGACDPLSSPRPLGPLVDVAPHLDPAVTELLASDERAGLFPAVLAALGQAGPTVLVVEDLQWADMSTLDLLRFLSRRIGTLPVLMLVTYRDDELAADDPVRVTVGDVAPQPDVRRVQVPLLSRDAVAELAAGTGLDPEALHAETGGNAFYVTEVIASGGAALPPTVQDAVLARVHRLSAQARLGLECAAVAGSRIEPTLLHGLPGVSADAVDECVSAGMLRFEAASYEFRHELLRQGVLAGITPGRLGALHWQVLDRLRTLPLSPRPYARLAEHAEMAGDPEATLEFAIAAGDSAARLGSHREAAFQYGRAMPFADLLPEEQRLDLLRKRARECQTSDDHEHAIEAFTLALDLLRPQGRVHEAAEMLFGLDESYYVIGDNSHGSAFIDDALSLLEGTEPSPQLAMAVARKGTNYLRQSRTRDALPWVERGLSLARETGAAEVVMKTTANLGSIRFKDGDHETGLAMEREALRLALEHGAEDLAARLYQNLAALHYYDFEPVEALALLEDAERFAAERDLHGHLLCILATEVTTKVELGRWVEAVEEAHDLLYVRNTTRASRMEPLVALGLVHARRADGEEVWRYLDEARDHIAKSQTLGYQAPIALARGEAHLLEGDLDAAREQVRPWFEEAVRLGDPSWLPELSLLARRLGIVEEPPAGLTGPGLLSFLGRHREAAQRWDSAGFVYQAAWCLLDSNDEVDLREARARFEQLGAAALVARTDAKLRAIGAKVPRGARATTRANLGGLTDREVEVLDLLDEGLRNAEIAARLHLSEKTVGHHVSSILAKLGVSSRLEAVHRARELAAVG